MFSAAGQQLGIRQQHPKRVKSTLTAFPRVYSLRALNESLSLCSNICLLLNLGMIGTHLNFVRPIVGLEFGQVQKVL